MTLAGEVELSRVSIADVPGIAAYATNAGSRLVLRDAHVFASASISPDKAISIEDGEAVLERVLVESGHTGVRLLAARGTLTDVVVRGTGPDSVGVAAGVGSTLDASHLLVEGATAAVFVLDSEATVRDSLVRDVLSDDMSVGIACLRASTMVLERVAVLRSVGAAVLVGRGAAAQIRDARIDGCVAGSANPYGNGVVVGDDGGIVLERAALRGNASGMVIGVGSSADLTDVLIDETTGQTSDARAVAGMGVVLLDNATAMATRLAVRNAHAAGVLVTGVGSRLTGADVAITGTALVCPDEDCETLAYATGLIVEEAAAWPFSASSCVTTPSAVYSSSRGITRISR